MGVFGRDVHPAASVDQLTIGPDGYRGRCWPTLARSAAGNAYGDDGSAGRPVRAGGALDASWMGADPRWERSPPTFRRIVGPLLRTAEQGADTLVWLAADDGAPLDSTGKFWLDRRVRDVHRSKATRRGHSGRTSPTMAMGGRRIAHRFSARGGPSG